MPNGYPQKRLYAPTIYKIFFQTPNSGSLLTILLTKTTATQIEVPLSYHRVHGLYFLAVVFVATIYSP